jgi:hypothetical protein
MTVRIVLEVPGSTAAQRETGVKAALDVLMAAGISPGHAQCGHQAREAWSAAGCPPDGITEEQAQAAAVFSLARLAAIEACEGARRFSASECRFEILSVVLH